MKTSLTFLLLNIANALFIAFATKPAAFTFEGAVTVIMEILFFYASYIVGRLDEKNERQR